MCIHPAQHTCPTRNYALQNQRTRCKGQYLWMIQDQDVSNQKHKQSSSFELTLSFVNTWGCGIELEQLPVAAFRHQTKSPPNSEVQIKIQHSEEMTCRKNKTLRIYSSPCLNQVFSLLQITMLHVMNLRMTKNTAWNACIERKRN